MENQKPNAAETGTAILDENRPAEGAAEQPATIDQQFELVCLPTTAALQAMKRPTVDMCELAAGLIAHMPDRFSDLKDWSVPQRIVEVVEDPHEAFGPYDRYFGVIRDSRDAAPTLIVACAKTLADIKETEKHGHDLSENLQADVLKGLSAVLELASE